MESLDADNTNEVDKVSYSKYQADKQAEEADEDPSRNRQEIAPKTAGKRTDGDDDALPWRDDDQIHF